MERLQLPAEHYIHVTNQDKATALTISAAVKILNDLAGEECIRYEIIEGTGRHRVREGVSREAVLVKTTFMGLGDPGSAKKVIELHNALGEVIDELHDNKPLAEAYGVVIPAT